MIYTVVFRDTKGRTMALPFKNLNRMDEATFRKMWFHCLNEGSYKINGRFQYDWGTVLRAMKDAGFSLQEDSCFTAMEDRLWAKEMDGLEEEIVRRSKCGIRV